MLGKTKQNKHTNKEEQEQEQERNKERKNETDKVSLTSLVLFVFDASHADVRCYAFGFPNDLRDRPTDLRHMTCASAF